MTMTGIQPTNETAYPRTRAGAIGVLLRTAAHAKSEAEKRDRVEDEVGATRYRTASRAFTHLADSVKSGTWPAQRVWAAFDSNGAPAAASPEKRQIVAERMTTMSVTDLAVMVETSKVPVARELAAAELNRRSAESPRPASASTPASAWRPRPTPPVAARPSDPKALAELEWDENRNGEHRDFVNREVFVAYRIGELNGQIRRISGKVARPA